MTMDIDFMLDDMPQYDNVPAADSAEVAGNLAWQKDRKRPPGEYQGGGMWSGFGQGGKFGLHLPSPAVGTRTMYRGGAFVDEETEGVFHDPEIARLRLAVLVSCRSLHGCLIEGLPALRAYAAALIARNYRITDGEMTAMLCHGTAWVPNVLRHALCGELGTTNWSDVPSDELMLAYQAMATERLAKLPPAPPLPAVPLHRSRLTRAVNAVTFWRNHHG